MSLAKNQNSRKLHIMVQKSSSSYTRFHSIKSLGKFSFYVEHHLFKFY